MRGDLNDRSPFADLVGRHVAAANAETGEVEVEYTAQSSFTNRMGILSGGMLSAMLDSVTSLAGLATLPEGGAVVHTELRVRYLKPGKPGKMVGRGRVMERGEREIRTRGELFNEAGELLAEAEATLRILRGRSAGN